MILLNRDSLNTVVLTLTEKVTLTGATFFLFQFTNDDTNVSKLFTAPDTSCNTCRYNQFDITVTGGTEDLTGGTIDIDNNGYWKYKVYQMTGSTNLDISGTTGIVETGKMYLSGTSLPIISEYTGATNVKFVYKG